ncbi:MAG TPA: cobyrinate a,c-diamide synthase [Lentisphaeria bacterium]|nr:MAG: cobyrinic acid a,c-diamide synthase [Lentisphaerae bacterium GWF2_49_21]HBC88937.1 cobyrinate a,c-diamide synthase [Lentisphaeria bacterium]
MEHKFYAFCIAGTNSGVGKTTITLGLLRALKKRGLKVAPFKCGPDYIDTAFHKAACGSPSRNLDTWMTPRGVLSYIFKKGCANSDCAVIEGVMGMFDGAKAGKLKGSTADVAMKLDVPVLLAVNARGMAGSIAPIVKGYTEFNKKIKIIGVIANNVSSGRHAQILKDSLKVSNLPPLIGWIPRDETLKLPERHLGLVPAFENIKTQKWFDRLARICEENVDIDRILKVTGVRPAPRSSQSEVGCQACPAKPWRRRGVSRQSSVARRQLKNHPITKSSNLPIRIAIAHDDAFNFYYEDNFDVLRDTGHELVFFSPLKDKRLPDGVSALYIGGGFPEVFAKKLSANKTMLKSVADFADAGGNILAECGGFMYLSRSIFCGRKKYNMARVIPYSIRMEEKLHSLGYREIKLLHDSFLGRKGMILRGHEFHWSSAKALSRNIEPAFMARGTRDKNWSPAGIRTKSVIASYMHLYFPSNQQAFR